MPHESDELEKVEEEGLGNLFELKGAVAVLAVLIGVEEGRGHEALDSGGFEVLEFVFELVGVSGGRHWIWGRVTHREGFAEQPPFLVFWFWWWLEV